MHRLLALVVVALTLPGCFVFFDEHGSGGGDDDDCAFPAEGDGEGEGGELPPGAPRTSVALQRNPQTLACEALGGGPGTCNPQCGPCPDASSELAPLPSWGFCFSSCESLDEPACESDPTCRVIKDAECAISGTCATDFLACVVTDQFTDASVDCTQVTDADSCSRNPGCTAYHLSTDCTLDNNDPTCTAEFAFCGPEGTGAGRCFEPTTCKRAAPSCPAGTTPGVANGCFTDACIPDELCEAIPEPA